MDRQILRRLHDIKYRELSQLIDKKITIETFHSMATDVETEVRPYLPPCGKLKLRSDNALGVLASYNMLDLSFATETPVLSKEDKINRKTLFDLNLWEQKSQDKSLADTETGDEDDGTSCLELLIEYGQAGYESLKIFLDVWPEREPSAEYRQAKLRALQTGTLRSPEFGGMLAKTTDIFPQMFVVRDACLTNSDFVWISKHFYM